eukprot:CCRYP_004599-RA/>CCRYP_004599-RA protein AED:0.04 eAED:0.04 QI:305/1/1/1/1/1/9/380/1018
MLANPDTIGGNDTKEAGPNEEDMKPTIAFDAEEADPAYNPDAGSITNDGTEEAGRNEEAKATVDLMGEPHDLESNESQRRPMLISSGIASAPGDDLPFESHFTLRIPISTLQYRGALLRVVDTDDDQIILTQVIDNKNKKILVKRISPESSSQKFLRIGYTLVTILFVGFLFVFCFQVLLFLVVALPVYSGYSTGSRNDVSELSILSTLLAFPVMLYGMSSLMAMGSAFVMDTWRGGTLFRSNVVEMLNMFVFLIAPVTTLMICLMAKAEESWRITAGVWCGLVIVTFCVWSLAVTIREVKACFWLVEKLFYKPPEGNLLPEVKWRKMMAIARISLLKSQTARYAGTRKERYYVAGTDTVDGDDEKGFSSSGEYTPVERKTSLYSRLTALECCTRINLFDKLDPPKRVWKPNELLETPSIMTKNNWVMQRMWCGGADRQQKVIIANGPHALTPIQVKYSVLCTVLSSVLVTLLVIGFLVWMEQGAGVYVIVGVAAVICIIYPLSKSSYELQQMYDSVNQRELQGYSRRDVNTPATGTTLFQVWETVRTTQPKEWYCYARAILEIFFLFLWPFIALLVLRNYPVAWVFLIIGFFSFMWRYFDASAVLSEYGTMSKIKEDELNHSKKYFFSTISQDVINNKGRSFWTYLFVILFLVIVFLFFVAQKTSEEVQPQERKTRPPVLLVDGFYYPAQNDTLAYPTCELTKGFTFSTDRNPDVATSSLLGDYAFLSAMAYETSNVTNYTLDKWFGGSGIIVDDEEFVSNWRAESGTDTSPVYFKLFRINPAPEFAIMSIRGSETAYDWIVNMQLWSSAGLAQTIKWLTPFGWIWAPILPDLIKAIGFVQSRAIRDVAYYRVTTRFVNDILGGYGETGIDKMYITGASLGGGLAVITGAQTEAYTVAISGLGAKLPRKMFNPPIELDHLNSHTFNFIPNRDYIARIGGRQEFFQNALCQAPKNNLFGCHSMWRSVCEINFRCGTNGRPVLCKCQSQFGYPVPVQNGTRSFQDACEEAQEEWEAMFQ